MNNQMSDIGSEPHDDLEMSKWLYNKGKGLDSKGHINSTEKIFKVSETRGIVKEIWIEWNNERRRVDYGIWGKMRWELRITTFEQFRKNIVRAIEFIEREEQYVPYELIPSDGH